MNLLSGGTTFGSERNLRHDLLRKTTKGFWRGKIKRKKCLKPDRGEWGIPTFNAIVVTEGNSTLRGIMREPSSPNPQLLGGPEMFWEGACKRGCQFIEKRPIR